jgi:Tol biopolymer transport system component
MRALPLLLALAGVAGTASASTPSPIVFDANLRPQFYGEIYRADPNGTRVDLSRSPGADFSPSVSPNGKQVAFASSRGGRLAIYVVGIDGSGLRRISPLLFREQPGAEDVSRIAWSPNGHLVAVSVQDNANAAADLPVAYLADLHGGWHAIPEHGTPGWAAPTWSPDGSRLAFVTKLGTIEVTTPAGKPLWSVTGIDRGVTPEPAWSSTGLLAVQALSKTIRVFDQHGRRIASFGGWGFAWAPSGNTLAYQVGKHVALRHASATAAFLTIPQWGGPQWIDSQHLAIDAANGWVAYDLATGTTQALPNTGLLTTSPAGAIVAQTGAPESLELSYLGSTPQTVLAQGPSSCGSDEDAFGDVQFVPHSSSVVYQTTCWNAPADLYAVNADGSGLRDVTKSPTDESQPSVSPDGTTVAYIEALTANCHGCNQSLSVIPLAGGTPTRLTDEDTQSALIDDEFPSWSPDGKEVVFVHGTDDGPSHLFEIPVQGRTMRDLGIKAGYDSVMGPKLVAYFGSSPTLTVKTVDPSTGVRQTVSTGAKLEQADSLAWSRAGKLAYLAWPHGAASIVIVGGRTIALAPLLPPGSMVHGLAWSPDGTRFAFTATDANGVGEVYTIGTDGTHLTQVTHDIGANGDVSWR